MRLKKSKRLVSLLLAGSMMVSMVPASAVTAFAASEANILGTSVVGVKNASEVVPVVVSNFETDKLSEAVQAAAALQSVNDITQITKLTVSGGTLGATDFEYLSGRKDGDYNSSNVVLTNMTELDLSGIRNKEIPASVFGKNDKIQKIILPKNLHKINKGAFGLMSELNFLSTDANKNLQFEGLEIFGESIAYKDANLSGVLNLPESLKQMGASSFEGTAVDGKIVIRNGVNITENSDYTVTGTKPCQRIFYGTKIENLTFEYGISEIPTLIASQCKQLKSVSIPESVKEIGDSAFNTTALTGTLFIPESVKTIGRAAFANNVNLDSIIVGASDVDLAAKAFVGHKDGVKIYFKRAVVNSGEAVDQNGNVSSDIIWNNTATILNTDGGTIETNSNGDVTAKMDNTTGLYTPTKEGYRFDGWYDASGNKLTTTAKASNTYTAKWHKYSAKIDTEEKTTDTKVNYIGTPVDIAVDVKAVEVDISSITKADIIFDDINAVEKVEVNGKTLDTYTNIDLYSLLKQDSDVATLAMVPVTKEHVILSVTFNTPGEHTVKIVLKDDANNVICSQDTTVKVVEKPILTFSEDCVVKVNDDEVKSGAEVEIGATVTVKLAKDVDSGMRFGSYVIDPIPDDLKLDGTTATFTMPEKSVDVKVRLETADTEDDSWDVATVITGVAIGAGAAVLTYHIGTELYAEQVLGKGVAVPKTREDVALKAWELAGKPAVELNGDPLSESAQAEKWAVESGLMQNDAEGNFNGTKKMNKLKALRVLDAAKKLA